MLQRIVPLLAGTILTVSAGAQEVSEIPFFMPKPEGWRSETIPFPLGFAPELDYEGLEEIRFAPGMFQEGAEDFWSYTFVWWLPATTTLDADALSRDLEHYFRGLSLAVAEGNGFDPGEPTFAAALQPAESPESGTDNERFTGRVETLDAFVTRTSIELNVQVEVWPCVQQKKTVVFFQLSPRPTSHPIWSDLQSIREGFRCEL